MQRFFFSGAAEAELDKQGRVMIPAALLQHARARPRRRRRRRARPPRDLGSRRLARAPERGRRECRACCRTSCNRARLITSPSSPTRCASCSRSQPGQTRRRRHLRRGRPRGAARRRPAGRGPLHRDRPRPDRRARTSRRFRRQRGRPGALPARRLRDVLEQLAANGVQADAILLDLGVSSMQLDRPERGFSYAADAPLDMRMDPSAELLGARARQRGVASASWPTIFRRYGEERYARQIARAIVGAVAASSRSSARATSSRRSRPRSRRRRGSARAIRRSASSRRCGSRSTTSSACSRGRCRPRSRCCARRPARRDQLPLARGPDRQAVPARRGARLHLPARLPGLRLRPRAGAARADREGRSGRAPRRLAANPRAGLGAAARRRRRS